MKAIETQTYKGYTIKISRGHDEVGKWHACAATRCGKVIAVSGYFAPEEGGKQAAIGYIKKYIRENG
jgi:hypothetical protein